MMIEDNQQRDSQDNIVNDTEPSGIFIPPPVPERQETQSSDPHTTNPNYKKKKSLLFYVMIFIVIVGLIAFGGRFLSSWQEEKQAMELSLEDTIIGTWILYMDNSGIGAYVNLNADGSLQLTEGRLGEWVTTKHRIVNENGIDFVEFFDEELNKWVRFMEIKKVGVNELHLIYLQ